MKKKIVINVKEREKAIKEVDVFKKKKYENKDIRFSNVDLLEMNKLFAERLFIKVICLLIQKRYGN